MSRLKDLTGMTFGKLEVKERAASRVIGKQTKTFWVCECECGNILEVTASVLQRGQQSCGKCIVRRIDMTGQQFGRLEIIKLDKEKTVNTQRTYWFCRCECGEIASIRSDGLVSGLAQSCGCLQREVCGDRRRKHGMYLDTEYAIYQGIKQRCYNPLDTSYSDYGKRGIKVCGRWLDSFENFFEDMGKRPNGMTLDRKDNNGPYSPDNCRWATNQEQCNNTRQNIDITYEGKTQSLAMWAREKKITYNTLRCRYTRQVSLEDLFSHKHLRWNRNAIQTAA